MPAEPRHLGLGRIFGNIDQHLVTARIVQAIGNQMLHGEPAQVAERHRRTVGLLGAGCHRLAPRDRRRVTRMTGARRLVAASVVGSPPRPA
jgi:hypothetical protein